MSGRLDLAPFLAHAAAIGARDRAALEAARAALLRAWAEPHRAYHTLAHLDACLGALATAAAHAVDPDAIAIALWYHDAIYEPFSPDNEGESAALARRDLAAAGAPSASIARVADLVLATRHDATPTDPDSQLLVDIDLGILGAPPDRYARYEDEVRREYGDVPDVFFRPGRARILRSFLDRPRIFLTPPFASLEAPARANLAWAIARLESDPAG